MSAPRDDESGFTLIEVLVSALLVLAIAGGALAALGSADASSGSARAHTVATAVAEQALEGLRSQSPTKLMSYVGSPPSLAPVTQNHVTYQRTVTAAWQTEQAGASLCAGPLAGVRYLVLKATVSYADRGRDRSVDASTLVAVPAMSNTAKVSVHDAAESPFAGLSVELRDGGANYVDAASTSAAGCVEWDYLEPGDYVASVTRAGYVAPDGSPTASASFTVTHARGDDVVIDYDRAAALTVRFYAQWAGKQSPWCTGTPCPKIYAPAGEGIDEITARDGEQPADRVFGTPGDEVPQVAATDLFPFATGYSIFPGRCLPSGSGVPAGISATVSAAPGATTPVELRLPELGIGVRYKTSRRGTVSAAAGARIVLDRQAGDGCPADRLPSRFADANGLMPFPGVPSGTYVACAEVTQGGATYHAVSGSLDVRDFNQPGAWNVTVGAYSGTGQSPAGACP